ncbi:hypothetical protein [Ruegeria marina]|uniref:Copper resistance protein B n=1 Tax=Ruegeria marina TaxID=639004 RepID=A0A1G6LUJ3_9RHOB|nr:hypothetical protein [Ruegeria marina]SDC46890.1 hypothetical protein SAMN04488239_102332 [Ruegeria marina]
MGRVLLALWICLFAAGQALAGAWLRDHGTGFTAVSTTLYRFDGYFDYKSAVYGEWGADERWTLGLDINEQPGLAGHVLLFVRYPLADMGRRGHLAAEAGLGGHHWLGDWGRMTKITLSYGKGLDTRWGHGWVAADTAWERRFGTAADIFKLDLTAGLSTPRRIDPMLQLETAYVAGLPLFWTLTPSLLIDAGKGGTWVVGLERKSDLPGTIGLKLGFWRNF